MRGPALTAHWQLAHGRNKVTRKLAGEENVPVAMVLSIMPVISSRTPRRIVQEPDYGIEFLGIPLAYTPVHRLRLRHVCMSAAIRAIK